MKTVFDCVRFLRGGDRGQVLPITGLAMVVLIGVSAMAVDVGYWRYEQRIAQSAADSAAIAGANELAYIGATDSVAAAKNDAALNGFTDGSGTTTVTVNEPPTSGAYTGNATAVEVIVKTKVAPFFTGYFGISQWVSARAVAIGSSNAPNCIIALTGDITLNGGGGGGITANTCGVMTNANLTVTGGANVSALTIGYVGTAPSGGTYPLGHPRHAVAVTDPCPTVPGCAYLTNATLHNPSALHTGCMPQSPLPNPLPPGEYCHTVGFTGDQAFSPGLFVFDDGFSANGNANLTGTGVTLYNGGGVALSGVTFSGNVNINLSAPTTGPTAGMVYYQPASNESTFTSNGRAGIDNFVGGFYLPTADFQMNGNIPNVTFLVAASVTMNGGGMGAGANTSYAVPVHGVLAE